MGVSDAESDHVSKGIPVVRQSCTMIESSTQDRYYKGDKCLQKLPCDRIGTYGHTNDHCPKNGGSKICYVVLEQALALNGQRDSTT